MIKNILLFYYKKSSIVCTLWTASSLCRGLEYILKVSYIILIEPNVAGFSIANTVFVTEWKHCPMSEKISQK